MTKKYSEALDNSKNYLRIFTSAVVIDKNLPKWELQRKEHEKTKPARDKAEQEAEETGADVSMNEEGWSNLISLDRFNSMNSRDFNIYVNKRVIEGLRNNFKASFGSDDFDNQIIIQNKEVPQNSYKTILKKVTKYYREFVNYMGRVETQEVIEMDIFEFFKQVKLTTKESAINYVNRIEPYMIALKDAQEMGQQALVDKLTAEIFNNKYESILVSEGFNLKINEEQLVYFIKRAEKGISLCYIKHFIRPIPQKVLEIKRKADSLLVFDNYVVLYYNDETMSYMEMTEAEKEEQRRKKADPILFGVISGSRNLYYIADWIDDYCDLTLEEFVKVSGIDKQHLKIDEKIKL